MAASKNTSTLISQIYVSRGVVLELLASQQYDVSNYELFSLHEVNAMHTNQMLDMTLTTKPTASGQKTIYVKYALSKAIRADDLQEMVDDLFLVEELLHKETDSLLVIVRSDMNDTLKAAVKHIWESDGVNVMVQSIKRLQFNILKHHLQPTFRILSTAEKEQVKQQYNIVHDEQFPDLSRFDPIVPAIGIRPGEVCEIIRPSKTGIDGIAYRMCINL